MSDTTPATAPETGADRFPSYGDWLTSHDNGVLVDLLWRLRTFHGHQHPTAITDAVHSVADIAALRQLDAASLAVLHALVHTGAALHPVTVGELIGALEELCDSAGTAQDHRPTEESLPDLLTILARRALVYGPTLRIDGRKPDANAPVTLFPLAVPEHLQALFTGTTDLPWVLIDGYRCPVPTAEIPAVLAELPDRQRRLLDTLANAGGIGHSETLDDAERPLGRMIAAGLLDRVDTETARLSPRVATVIAGRVTPDPGGNFAPLHPPSTVAIEDGTNGVGVARAVETVRHVTDLLTELGATPLRPLSGGGVGTREITRISKNLGVSPEEATETLLLCRHADLIASDGVVWGVTNRGAEFLDGATAQRWALLLSGWMTSPHAPWDAARMEARLLQESLDQPRAAALRQLTAALLSTCDTTTDPAVQLWRLRPALAARTDTAALTTVLREAEGLGLCAGGLPTGAAVALAEMAGAGHDNPEDPGNPASTHAVTSLTTALENVLPDPVRMLIIQADLTVLAPGLLDADTEAMLRRIAEVESTGMASVWRISPESLARAAASGETAQGVRGFLSGMAPEIPQGLDYLISDAFRSAGALTADTAATVLTAPDEETLSTALSRLSTEDIRDSGLQRIAPTVAVSHIQLSRVVHTLEDAGIRVGVEGDAPAAAPGPLITVVPDPWRPGVTRAEVEDQLEATVESFRRARQRAATPEGTEGAQVHDLDTETVRDPRAIMTALRSAYDQGTHVEISYVNAEGTAVQEWISVVTMSPVAIIGVTESDGRSLRIQPHRIAWVATPAQ